MRDGRELKPDGPDQAQARYPVRIQGVSMNLKKQAKRCPYWEWRFGILSHHFFAPFQLTIYRELPNFY
jgi:hypothetical protein